MVVTVSSLIMLMIIIVFLVGAILVVMTYLISTFMGQPFVPTTGEDIDQILGTAQLPSSSNLLELGCGDGRFVAYAVKNVGVEGTGIELNPLLAVIAIVRGKLMGLQKYKIKIKDIRKYSYKDYDAIYLFLFPSLIEEIQNKMLKECRKGALIISHGFVIPALHEKYLENTLTGKGFRTYFYRIH
jgi:SAM-dependent methyltransferase